MQIERIPGAPICYWPMLLGPWEDEPRRRAVRVVIWLWWYVTLWVAPGHPGSPPA
jgi:hypothetical protein